MMLLWKQLTDTPISFFTVDAGIFVVGPGEQGILLEHREKEWGDLANTTDILSAVRRMAVSKS